MRLAPRRFQGPVCECCCAGSVVMSPGHTPLLGVLIWCFLSRFLLKVGEQCEVQKSIGFHTKLMKKKIPGKDDIKYEFRKLQLSKDNLARAFPKSFENLFPRRVTDHIPIITVMVLFLHR